MLFQVKKRFVFCLRSLLSKNTKTNEIKKTLMINNKTKEKKSKKKINNWNFIRWEKTFTTLYIYIEKLV